ncbi:hypothetical protein HMN09_01266000 [Mycena chlorophos]|uniref:Uncharacterized protein n=1 Tax=Mycena chlorophos TaxID=658473 RepID=A0A8H6S2J7_MYCCL|nr:hypothetical protein HMN09_01266000 [Mycena chlorophos]
MSSYTTSQTLQVWPTPDPGNEIFKFAGSKVTTNVVDAQTRCPLSIAHAGQESVLRSADQNVFAIVTWDHAHPQVQFSWQDRAQEITDAFPVDPKTKARQMIHQGHTYLWKISQDKRSYYLVLPSAPKQRLAYWYINDNAIFVEIKANLCEPGLLEMIFLAVLLMSNGTLRVEAEDHKTPNGLSKFATGLGLIKFLPL